MKKSPTPPSQNTNHPSEDKKQLLYRLLLNTVLMLAIYYACIYFGFEYIFHIYAVAGLGLGFAYVIYNRGMAGRELTPDMLPDTMSADEKDAFLLQVKLRMHQSRWMLTLLFPIIVTVAIDIFYLFVLKGLLA